MSWLTREIMPNRRRGALSMRLTLLLSAGAMLMTLALCSPARLGVVSGHSMEPTLHPGRPFLYVRQKPGQQQKQYHVGEVVVVRMGDDICVKRIFGMGGDRLWLVQVGPDKSGLTPVDTQPPIEKWRERFPKFKFHRYDVPDGQVYLMGDSPSSCDSRQLGPVPVENILGRVVAPITPMPEIKPYPSWTVRPVRRIQRAGRRLAADV